MKRKSTLLCLGMIMAAVSFGQTQPKKPVPPKSPNPPTEVKDVVIEKVQEVTPPPPPPPPPPPKKKIHVKRHTKPAMISVPPKPPKPAKPKKEMKKAI